MARDPSGALSYHFLAEMPLTVWSPLENGADSAFCAGSPRDEDSPEPPGPLPLPNEEKGGRSDTGGRNGRQGGRRPAGSVASSFTGECIL